jgi:hypothetical protein
MTWRLWLKGLGLRPSIGELRPRPLGRHHGEVGAFGAVADRVAWGTSFRVTSLFRPATMPTMTPALRAQIASVVRHEWDGDIPEPVLVGALDAALTAYGRPPTRRAISSP